MNYVILVSRRFRMLMIGWDCWLSRNRRGRSVAVDGGGLFAAAVAGGGAGGDATSACANAAPRTMPPCSLPPSHVVVRSARYPLCGRAWTASRSPCCCCRPSSYLRVRSLRGGCKPQIKEYFLWFCLLSVGGFRVLYLGGPLHDVHVLRGGADPDVPADRRLGHAAARSTAAMKLTLMLMGGSALLLIGILGIYFFTGAGSGYCTMNILEIAQLHSIPLAQQYVLVSAGLRRVRRAGRAVPVPYMESRRPCLGSDGGVDAPCRGADEAGRLRLFPRGDVPDA